ncbi:hypothetical protein F5883DRAFT_548802 [Diaporthe sp. PMI_573]|nr:hypothetical protein F5883DRAFT_548802 [Diaporthaceae sp. PMI_573]
MAVPGLHVTLLITAIDKYVAALDDVDKELLQLHVLLDAQQRAGWEIEELEDGVCVRTQVGLPAPRAIEKSVSARLERAMAGSLRDAGEILTNTRCRSKPHRLFERGNGRRSAA